MKIANGNAYLISLKSRDCEFTQYLNPVSVGPSEKTCPRWPSQLEHIISVRTIPCVRSFSSFTFLLKALENAGQPQWELNFEVDSNKSVPQPEHL